MVLWPDTFNNYFHPETAIAAVEVLEAAGFEVLLPAGHVCCGRPLYDFGMLKRAKKLLQQALEILRTGNHLRNPCGRARAELRLRVS